jgi:diaminopimelate epimerase
VAGWSATSSRSHRGGPDQRHDHRSRERGDRDGARDDALQGLPDGAADGRGELEADGRRWSFQHVSIGNPQCAIACEELEQLDLPAIGPAIEHDPLFPNRTNVSWYRPLEPGVIRARIFERGVGETLSSGTGACGAAVAHHLAGGPRAIVVALDGGELRSSWGRISR